jgi:SAM-dependent methyltransferase
MTRIANTDEYAAWNGDNGQRWVAGADHRDTMLASVGEVLLAAAGLRDGERVLDVGCGCGATTLAAADAVGPGGRAVGVDLSEPMLAVARARAEAAGRVNVEFVQADAQVHPLGAADVDVAVSRFGTMFFGDPSAAFANIGRALRPGGRLCIATWQPLVANDWLMAPGAVLLSFGTLPEPGTGPGMFAQSDPAAVASVLAAAGFDQVDVTAHTVPLLLGADPAEAAALLAESGPGRATLETVPEADRPAALEAVRAVLAEHVTPAGVQLDGAVLVTTAVRPER